MPYKECNDINIYYEIHGKGEPLVLISGLGGDRTFWLSSLPVLSAEFQVIIFDIRGIGRTDAPAGPYSIEMFADDLAALMDGIGIAGANILGFSMGGNIALSFTLKYPQKVTKLIIAASFAAINIQSRLYIDAVLAAYEAGITTKQMFDLVAPWLFSAEFLARPGSEAYLQYDENDPEQQPLFAWKNQYLAQREFNSVGSLQKIITPTLIIAAENDRLAHVADSLLLAENISGAELKIISGSGHLCNFEQPEVFHRHVQQFLQQTG